MDERMYLTGVIPHSEVAPHVKGVAKGESIAPGAFGYAVEKDAGLARRSAAVPAARRRPLGLPTTRRRRHEVTETAAGLTITSELFRTSEGDRALTNCRESTTSLPAEFAVFREHFDAGGVRVIDLAYLSAVALVPNLDGAYRGAKVTKVESAAERRAAKFTGLGLAASRVPT